jgi:tRNA A-37 threonylcarbamoyl transferase component Bud32
MTLLELTVLLTAGVAAGFAAMRLNGRRRVIHINPCYGALLSQHGIDDPDAIWTLPGVVVSGHPDRNVSQVCLGGETMAFLKRELRVPWRERLHNAWAGFGLVSKARREAVMLGAARAAGLPCPEWIAVGRAGDGQAFLLVAERKADDLRSFLTNQKRSARYRWHFARRLGHTFAAVHDAGFDHPDLYAKHILVDADGEVCLLDWQRSRHSKKVAWRQRRRDLAALDATLASDAAGPRERLAFLKAYLNAAQIRLPRTQAAHQIRAEAEAMIGKRHVRQAREAITVDRQHVVWLEGEALCVTPDYLEETAGRIPNTVRPARLGVGRVEHRPFKLTGSDRGQLSRREAFDPVGRLVAALGGRRRMSPEVRQAGLLYRLQRHAVTGPRLLAFGQRWVGLWRLQSMLLTQSPAGAVPLRVWLARCDGRERLLIRAAGHFLRRLHAAGCSIAVRGPIDDSHVLIAPGPTLTLGHPEAVRLGRSGAKRCVARDLRLLRHWLAPVRRGRTDDLRFILAYLDKGRVTPGARLLMRQLGRPASRPRRASPFFWPRWSFRTAQGEAALEPSSSGTGKPSTNTNALSDVQMLGLRATP